MADVLQPTARPPVEESSDLFDRIFREQPISGASRPVELTKPSGVEIFAEKGSLDLRFEAEKVAEAQGVAKLLATGDTNAVLKAIKDAPDQKDLVNRLNNMLKNKGISLDAKDDALYLRTPDTASSSKSRGSVTVRIPFDSPEKVTGERRDWTGENPEAVDGKQALAETVKTLRDMLGSSDKTEKQLISEMVTALQKSGGHPDKETAEKIRKLFKDAYETGGADGANKMERAINEALRQHTSDPTWENIMRESGLSVFVQRSPLNPNSKLIVYMRQNGQNIKQPGSGDHVESIGVTVKPRH